MLSLLLTLALGAPPDVELLFFTAPWCGACRQMGPVVANLRRQGFPIREVDVDREPQTAGRYGVTALPTFVVVENGSARTRVVGATTEGRLRALVHPSRSPAPAPQPLPRTPDRPSATSIDPQVPGAAPDLARLRAASVKVVVRRAWEHWYGSGTCVGSDGGDAVVLTAAHVVRDAAGGSVEIVFPDGRQFPARVRYADPRRDVAVLVVATRQPLPTVPLGGRNPRPGEPVVSVGYPGGGRQRTLSGRVVSVGRWSGYTEASMSASQGHSGGGLFCDGRLVGVLWGSNGTSLYASLGDVRAALDAAGLSSVGRIDRQASEGPPRNADARPAAQVGRR